MLLACLVGVLLSLSTTVVASPKMSGTGTSRASRDGYDSAVVAGGEGPVHGEAAEEEDLEEDAVKVARRAVRRFPEESEGVLNDHPQEPVPINRLSCDCPEVLSKGTLAAIVAALTFLGFFATSVLLVVSIWILRLLGKQKKSETSDSSRSRPPPTLPRPEHTFGHGRRSSRPYESMLRPEGVYLSANEINLGPRFRKEDRYGGPRMSPEAKYSPENEYVGPSPLPFNPPEGIYARIQSSSGAKIPSAVGSPGFQTGSPGFHGGSPVYPSGSPGFHGGSPSVPSGSPVGSPGSPD